ncbi:MAG: cyclic nucleotide-binding domain-containing protein [Spirochaetales bacterium]|nr:cyclic nucleotide-binding domain-containing protein [Spirochaetales bacterium]
MEVTSDRKEILRYLMLNGWEKIFSPEAMEAIELCRYSPGEFIFHGGEKRKWFFLYVEGKSKVYRVLENGEIMLVRFYKPFQLMGDLEVFMESHSISTVKAISPVCCLRLPIDLVKKECRSNITLVNHLARGLAEKLASFNTTAAVNQHYTLDVRLASYLCMIYLEGDEFKESKDEMGTENLSEMADFLGCSYRHLGRTLEVFKKERLIEKKGRSIRILDAQGLREKSQGVMLYEN